MRTQRLVLLVSALLLIAFLALVHSGRVFRTCVSRQWTIPLLNGDKAEVEGGYSNSQEFALGPSFVWGGRSPEYHLDITLAGNRTQWTGPLEPIILEKYGGSLWLVTWNSSIGLVKDEFVILNQRDGAWHRADRSEFPPYLAAVNLDWTEAASSPRWRERIDRGERDFLESVDFCDSANARFWLYLSGKETATIHHTIDASFVLDYYEKEVSIRTNKSRR